VTVPAPSLDKGGERR